MLPYTMAVHGRIQLAVIMLQSILPVLLIQGAFAQQHQRRQAACEQSSCYPATGDLLIGREERLSSTSTCGTDGPKSFCIVSHLEDKHGKQCFVCDSRQPYDPQGYSSVNSHRINPKSHRIANIVSTFRRDWNVRWWQAENGREEVSIQLDLEAEFHFTHLIMRFKTFRPSAMFVERSHDFGKTWHVYRYFAYDCLKSFPGIPRGPIRNIKEVICESRYSDVAPSTAGEVIFRVLPPSIEIEDPYSQEVQDLLKMTNLRVNFTHLHTLGDDLLDSRDDVKEKYYYAMYDMVVRGSCSCYGHASRCLPLPGYEDDRNAHNMVHGRCECTHNTIGLNCEKCEDFYNDLPWRPAQGRETSACKSCDCNNHATRCHFDPAVYELTGRMSGGVCDDCQHNTMGRQCDECKPFFYRDPSRQPFDADVCKPCDCDPNGSEHGGECESHDDPAHDLQAGRCICKHFVEGRRCDTCTNGYWNMRSENPDGCESCSCNTLGTIGNYGCDKNSGECRCKRYVTGRDCDQCFPQYWGISEEIEGCKACDCDVGGASDNNCDQKSGQCNCRLNIGTRRCSEPSSGFFVPGLDWLIYEAEYAHGTGNSMVVIREWNFDRVPTWTGTGFMRVSERDAIEFTIDNIQHSMEYDIIIRYEPQMPERWDDVRVTVTRPGAVDQSGPCANSIPQDDLKATALPPGVRYFVVRPSSCLESGVTYTLRLDFNRYRGNQQTSDATVLIDSIILVPSTQSISIFQGQGLAERRREEFERYRCPESQYSVVKQDLPDICRQHIFSISAIMYDGARDCDCDPTGSLSSDCQTIGGQCQCRPNVIGRRCDMCAPGTYGFGPSGCVPCNCNAIGSRDNFCDAVTGQCPCMHNVYGRQCDECQRGYWGYPNCRPCSCNGRAEECANAGGQCIQCGGNTGGMHCDRCASGYYGDPSPTSNIGCRACMCPGGADSGFQHGDTCDWIASSNQVKCQCHHGYAGFRCDQCAENYFGNPLIPGGTCESCQCNGNIDVNRPGSCDAATGECLHCQYYTEGFLCEHCQAGYYGDATRQNCQACVCNLLGTDRDAGSCNRITGQCPCLPNVVGMRCDRCTTDHWKIASGVGCEACNCDRHGSLSTTCNEFDGQCQCVRGRGGRDCSQCEDFYWGDPAYQCIPCDCNRDGSETQQCDRRTGQCVCSPGVTGERCDRCARGTTGALPYCVPCGECFDNWDTIVHELTEETTRLIKEGSEIKIGGAPGAFDKEFQEMEDKLDDIRKILSGTNISETDLTEIRDKLKMLRTNLTTSNEELNTLEGEVTVTNQRVETAINRIDSIRIRVDQLKVIAEQLKANATSIRELDVTGAFNSTRESQRRSREAQRTVDQSVHIIRESETIRERVDILIQNGEDEYNRKYNENEQNLQDLNTRVDGIDDKIVDLNEQVCDGRGDPCDLICGGAGCGICGKEASCDDGAVGKADLALNYSKRADQVLRTKREQMEKLLTDVNSAQDLTNMAKGDALMSHGRAMEAKNISESTRASLEILIQAITDFLDEKGARPAEIRQVAEEVLAMTISLTPQEIQDLARQINETIRGLTDIETILNATRDDLRIANGLKIRADKAKAKADDVLNTAERIVELLNQAKETQDVAKEAIDQANRNITAAENDLTMVESETSSASHTANQTLHYVRELHTTLMEVERKYLENKDRVETATREVTAAETLANEAEQNANNLEQNYIEVSVQLERKYNETTTAKIRADALRDRAAKLYKETYDKIARLKVMEAEFMRNEQHLVDISSEILILNRRMMTYVVDIQIAARYLRTCGTA